MDGAHKAPPQKRRRLSSGTSVDVQVRDHTTALATYSHTGDHIYTYILPKPTRINTRRAEEVHAHAHLHPMSAEHGINVLARQDTTSVGSSSNDTTVATSSSAPSVSTTLGSSSSTTSNGSTQSPSSISGTTSSATTPDNLSSSTSISSTSTSSVDTSSGSSSSTSPSSSSTSSSSSSTIVSSSSTSSTSSSSSSTTTTTTSSSSSSTTTSSTTSSSTTLSTSSTSTSSTTTTSTTSSSPSSTPPSTTPQSTQTTYYVTTVRGSESTITSVFTGSPNIENGPNTSATQTTTSTSTGLASSGNSNNSSSPPPGTIAGGVVGGAAGLAVVVLIAMLFVRWYKRKSEAGHLALPPGAAMAPETEEAYRSPGPGMAERAGLMPFGAHMPNFLRHQNRSVADGSEPSERGFRRVSGRKLPSAFSEGMSSSGPSSAPLRSDHSRTMSSSGGAPTIAPFYRDHVDPFYGEPRDEWNAPSSSPPAGMYPTGYGHGEDHELMTMSPGPERTPTVQHAPRDYYRAPRRASDGRFGMSMSPPPAAGSATRFARSDTSSSVDPSRNSRFTEEM